jgi:hypothetical protein
LLEFKENKSLLEEIAAVNLAKYRKVQTELGMKLFYSNFILFSLFYRGFS